MSGVYFTSARARGAPSRASSSQGGWALARRTAVRKAHFCKPCGFAVRSPGVGTTPPTAAPSGRSCARNRRAKPSRTLPGHPRGWTAWRRSSGPSRWAERLAQLRRKDARRWAVPCHGGMAGDAAKRVALQRPQALSSAAPGGLREGLTPPPRQRHDVQGLALGRV